MKQSSIKDVISELERIYDYVAKKRGLNAPRPIIIVQTKGRMAASGWFSKDRWKKGKTDFSEINICAEHLKDNPIETLIHEMVHYHNTVNKVNDCNSQQYHNKAFKEMAGSYGLNVKRAGRFGWAMPTISEDLQKDLKTLKINHKVFDLFRKPRNKITAPTKMKKWSCGCTIVRCATQLSAVCEICQNRFEEKL